MKITLGDLQKKVTIETVQENLYPADFSTTILDIVRHWTEDGHLNFAAFEKELKSTMAEMMDETLNDILQEVTD